VWPKGRGTVFILRNVGCLPYWFRFPSSYRYYIICAFILHLTAYQISEMHGEHRFAVCDVVRIMSKFVTGMFEK